MSTLKKLNPNLRVCIKGAPDRTPNRVTASQAMAADRSGDSPVSVFRRGHSFRLARIERGVKTFLAPFPLLGLSFGNVYLRRS